MFTDVKYLTVSEDDQSWGIYVTTIGFQKIAFNTPYPPAGHPEGYMFNTHTGRVLKDYQLIYITEGKGYFESSHIKKTPVEKGTILFLFPNEWHNYFPDKSTGWATYWIGFEGDYINTLIKNAFFSPLTPTIQVHLHETVTSLFIEAIKITKTEQSGYQQIAGGIVVHLLGLIRSIDINKQFERNNLRSIVEQARIIMKEKVDENISLQEIADRLKLSYSWFRKLFKNYTGLSPAKYQSQLRIQRAKEYLSDTTLSIKEIAFQMNFESITYFSAFFKSNVGMTPSEYIHKYVLSKRNE